jgi:hypothetical protein
MSKWYQVNVTICKTYAIQVPDDDKLEEFEMDECDYIGEELRMVMSMDDNEYQTDMDYVEIKAEVEIDRLKRHACEIVEIYPRSK